MWADAKSYVELIAAATVPLSVLAVVWHRVKSDMGMGVRSLQFLAIGVVIPIVLILALEKVLDAGVVGTILGAVVGYLFSSVARETKTTRKSPDNSNG